MMTATPLSRLSHPILLAGMIALWALISTPNSLAQDALGLGTSNSSNSLGLSSNEDTFLRVEQAYQVNITRLGDNQLTLDWQIAPNYYLYRNNFSFKVGDSRPEAQYPQGVVKFDEYFQEELEIYHDSAQIVLTNLPQPPYTLQVTSQGCADAGLCYPPYKQTFDVTDVGAIVETTGNAAGAGTGGSGDPGNNTEPTAAAPPFSLGTWVASLILAFFGGLILNLMPCVFPVLSIKALSLTNSQHQAGLHPHGWAYTAGCVTTFLVIAAVMLALRAGGAAIGWGFQLQSPTVIALLLYLFFVMGLSLSGVISLGSGLMGLGQSSTQGHQLHHSFMTGALASVVASPCTAPMMGAALGFAISQPAPVALSVFACLGLGMAAPFLLLTYLPAASQLLPKPGPWMDTLKQFLAFPMYLSCVWLLWVLANQTNNNHVALVAIGLVLIAFALWLWQHLPESNLWRKFSHAAATGAVIVAGFTAVSFKPSVDDALWDAYSPERLAQLRNQEQAVLINLTASWCITCLANEKVALSNDGVRQAMLDQGIQGLKGDWTNADPQITELLHQYGRTGVPLYLYFPPYKGAQAVILPQLLTAEIVLNTFSKQEADKIGEVGAI